MTQASVSRHDSDLILPESESNCLYYHIVTNHVYRSWPFLTQGVVEVPSNTATNDTLLPASTTELLQGTLAEDAPFELHIWNRVVINSMMNFMKGVRYPYIRETPSFCFSLISV